MKKVLISIFSSLVLSGPVAASQGEWVEWIADAQLSYAAIDNLNLSAFSNDSQNDQRLALTGVAGRFYQFNGFTRMSIALEIDVEKFQAFDLLDNVQLGGNIGLRHKFGLGFFQPYLQFNVDYRQKEVDWHVYSRNILFTRLEVGKHLDEQFSFAASFDFTLTEGEAGPVINPELSSDVFDQSFAHISVFADYMISQDWLLSASYARRQGDFHSACSKDNVAKVIEVERVKAITQDDVFGGCVYKLEGGANIYSALLSYSLNNHSAINLLAEHYQGRADVLDYQSTSYSLSLNYRY